jgi:hypothetical protein
MNIPSLFIVTALAAESRLPPRLASGSLQVDVYTISDEALIVSLDRKGRSFLSKADQACALRKPVSVIVRAVSRE